VKSVLMYREITLKNSVIVLSVPFVHHTELQNFLIAPRSTDSATTLSRMNLSGYVGNVTIFSLMFTVACCLVVGLGLRLGLGLG